MNDDEHSFIADKARDAQKAIKALGVKRTPSGMLKPTPDQVKKIAELKDDWFAEVAPLLNARRKELDNAHRAEMAKHNETD